MTPNQQKIIELLNRAEKEGAEQSEARIQELTQANSALDGEVAAYKAQVEKLQAAAKVSAEQLEAAQKKAADAAAELAALQAAQQEAATPSAQADGIPIHNVENRATFDFLNEVPPEGYAADDHSRVWPYLTMVQEDKTSWTERPAPYCIYGDGDTVIVECDNEPSQTITPYKANTGFFRAYLLTPGETYRWTMKKSGKVVKTGQFRTTGRVRWIGTEHPHNLRDIGGFGIAKFRRVYRAQNLAKVEVGDDDYNIIRNHLGINVQLNLTTNGDTRSPSRTDIFERTYNYNIPAYADLFTQSKANFKAAFEVLVAELKKGSNIIFNCWQGADRTGTFAWFCQAILGIPLGLCEASWELTGFVRDLNSKIWDEGDVNKDGLRAFIIKLIAKYKAATKETTYDSYRLAHYLGTKIIGIPEQTIKEFREIMMLQAA